MKLNIPKPVVKGILISIAAVCVFLIVYTYVKFTNDRVYEFAKEQVMETDEKTEPVTSANPSINAPEKLGNTAIRTQTNSVDNKQKVLISGKSAHTCMRELNTTVINNDVVKCTHDHYVKP
ncbi:MAG TPA: hypothetical protein VK949_08175 [Methylotenera sp.]|nr:hypothetical protein [Methylotenera sp.]